MGKSEEKLLTASSAANSETYGEDGTFWDHGDLDGKRKSGKTNYWTLLNYFCYS
jgi:hypothetical protein